MNLIRSRMASFLKYCATVLLSAALMSGMSSCIFEYGDDCPDRLVVTVLNDWTAAPTAAPGGMAYIFMPADGSAPWRYDFPGRDAGAVLLPPGQYSFLSFNDDTYNIRFHDEAGYDGYEFYTVSGELPAGVTATEPVLSCPDMMWGCAYGCVEVGYEALSYVPVATPEGHERSVVSTRFELLALQRPLTARYRFRITDISNLEGVRSMSASLSGMAGSLYPATGRKGNYPSTLALKAARTADDAVGGDFFTFGIPANPSARNVLSLMVVLTDGRGYCYDFDVTEQVRRAPDPMDVTLLISGLVIEPSESDEPSGFDVSVDGWETVVVNYTD